MFARISARIARAYWNRINAHAVRALAKVYCVECGDALVTREDVVTGYILPACDFCD